MKRALFIVVALGAMLLAASAALGDERTEKRRLVSELLEVIDAKALVQASFDNVTTAFSAELRETTADQIPEEYRAEWEAKRRKENEEFNRYRERLFARLDYVKFFDSTYAPALEEPFTADELRKLIDFFRTKEGQKLARILPRLGISAADGVTLFGEAAESIQKEIDQEREAKYPWRRTMEDLRSLATAVEARATDTEEYPQVGFEELEALIAPTYIRTVPKVDSWGTPYLYIGDGAHYRIVSAGADRRLEWSSRHLDLTPAEPRLSNDLDADIVFQDGNFLQSPAEAADP